MLAQVAVVTVTLSAALVVTAAPAQAQYVSVYASDSVLQNIAKSYMRLAIAGRDANYGEAWEYSADIGYMEWRVQDHAPNGHTIQEYRSPGLCLDSNHAGQLYGMACNGGDHQRWHFDYLGTQRDAYYGRTWTVYRIVNKATGRCLDANGERGYTLGCNNGDYQRWFMIDIAN
ncbi:RICIN domain-containing protein [Micromonospora zamorensis]|uniref:RICIN domain-containing protein n=1 Tax=Micromonospora zamorensis TaxID=709883 RepID=UPI0037AB9A96